MFEPCIIVLLALPYFAMSFPLGNPQDLSRRRWEPDGFFPGNLFDKLPTRKCGLGVEEVTGGCAQPSVCQPGERRDPSGSCKKIIR
ncbi:Hypothetical protein NTJ_09545 [Nesidiocoris tenuis]|uniref:Secreted protein n=1 Tax=Nesidiocoris tenuis TaxID=355587 RepID=A0ABN7AX31_9HEMI|nr:Hypothetical protein NTJ_09545 [Nesidiocoris tenuis]